MLLFGVGFWCGGRFFLCVCVVGVGGVWFGVWVKGGCAVGLGEGG
ncbi:hypothetical protein [Neisseria sp. P0022.S006]